MRRILLVAAVLLSMHGLVSAQATPLPNVLVPPTAPPTATSSATATTTVTFTPSPTLTGTLTPTETVAPDITNQPLNIDVAADVLFPAGVAFRVSFVVPETGLQSVSLLAEQENWTGEVFTANLAEVAIDEYGVATLYTLWPIPSPLPSLFEPILFTWEVLPRGRAAETAELELAFADPRFTWIVDQSPVASVRFAVPESRSAVTVAKSQIASLAKFVDYVGSEIDPISAAVFPSGSTWNPCRPSRVLVGSLTGFEVPCDSDAASAIYAQQGWEVLDTGPGESVQLVLTRAILPQIFPGLYAGNAAPEWFKIGLLGYLGGLYSTNDLESVRAASRSNLLLPALDVIPANDTELVRWRAQSTGVVIYMGARLGVRPLLDVAKRVDLGESLSVVWPAETGQDFAALLSTWRSWIFTPSGEAAYGFFPSLDPTPTLLPTRTVTPTNTHTSTFTPSRTSTSTLTPTPTLQGGFELPTARPTDKPSATPLPTLTPRPAEQFVLGDIPAEPEPERDNSPLIAFVGIVVVGAALGLIIAIILMFRRR
ncbi:MAG: hypothetical protein KA401_02735 [Anaerolineae bacterium]|nr:hypothetical protein [Anaerolineae bacterium]